MYIEIVALSLAVLFLILLPCLLTTIKKRSDEYDIREFKSGRENK